MDRWPEQPDPQHDRHVAFPDDPATPPPESWWAANPPPPPPPVEVRSTPPPRRSRKGAAWWAVVAVFLFGGIMSSGHDSGGPFPEFGGSAYGEAAAPAGVDLVEEPTAPGGHFEPADAALYRIPSGTLWFRLEVVGGDPRATADVTSASGAQLDTGELGLPYAGRLSPDNPDDSLTVTVHGAYGQKQIQCRVYLDDALVAIGTGLGTATCEVPASR